MRTIPLSQLSLVETEATAIVLGLTLNVVVPQGTKASDKLPVAVVSFPAFLETEGRIRAGWHRSRL